MKRINPAPFGAMKPADYLRQYEVLFKDMVDKKVALLELGIYKGGSLLMWQDYFQNGVIAGIDLNVPTINNAERISMYQGNQQDTEVLDRIGREVAPGGFDVILDDASHIGIYTKASFIHLFQHHLKPGGLYILEDWSVSYWNTWVDGATPEMIPGDWKPANPNQKRFLSVDYGMAGFVKQLVDECGASTPLIEGQKRLATHVSEGGVLLSSLGIQEITIGTSVVVRKKP